MLARTPPFFFFLVFFFFLKKENGEKNEKLNVSSLYTLIKNKGGVFLSSR